MENKTEEDEEAENDSHLPADPDTRSDMAQWDSTPRKQRLLCSVMSTGSCIVPFLLDIGRAFLG
jgi:hypothetical protein